MKCRVLSQRSRWPWYFHDSEVKNIAQESGCLNNLLRKEYDKPFLKGNILTQKHYLIFFENRVTEKIFFRLETFFY
jgi:hypothetical protein